MMLRKRPSCLAGLLGAFLLAGCAPALAQTAGYSDSPASPYVPPSSTLPGPPTAPTLAKRPSTWPGTAPAAAPAKQVSSELTRDNEVQILARINGEVILASEVLPLVDDIINANKAQIPPDQLEAQRNLLIKQRMKSLIETKTLIAAARAKLPAEGIKNLEKNLGEAFDKDELKKLYTKTKTDNKPALEAELKKMGTSLDKERRSFVERQLAREWLKHNIADARKQEVSHEQMLAYYRQHQADYEFPAKARWQQLTIRAGKTRPKGEAYARLAELGNRVHEGEAFEEIAKKHSEGPTAATGGVHNWTTKGSLVSAVLDEALFTQRVGELSKTLIEDEQGFHIIRVLERTEAGRKPFLEAQAEIKQKLQQERIEAAIKEYIAEVKDQIKVWTIFDGDRGLQPVAEAPPNTLR